MPQKNVVNATSAAREYWKFLGLIIALTLAATLMSTLVTFHWTDWFRWYIGSFFLLFGGFKLIGYEGFTHTFGQYDYVSKKYAWYPYVYPFAELVLGVFYVLDVAPFLRNGITLILMLGGLYSLLKILPEKGPSAHTTALGRIIRLPLTTALLFENMLITAMVALMIITGM